MIVYNTRPVRHKDSRLSVESTCSCRCEDCLVPICRPAAMIGQPPLVLSASVRTMLLSLQTAESAACLQCHHQPTCRTSARPHMLRELAAR